MRVEIQDPECATVAVDSGPARHYMNILAKPGFTIRYVTADEECGKVSIMFEPVKAEGGIQ